MVSAGRPQIRILVADDHPVVREGLRGLIAVQPDIVVVAEASNGREAIQQFRIHRPDVTVMDLQMPEMNGVDAVSSIRVEFPGAKIIMLTTYVGDVQIFRALKAGAQGYLLLKAVMHKELLDKIARFMRDARLWSEAVAQVAEHRARMLTRRNWVLRSIAGATPTKTSGYTSRFRKNRQELRENFLDSWGHDRTHAVTEI